MTAENFMEFIRYPLTILFILLGLLLVMLLILFEVCALFGCMEASWKKQKVHVPKCFVWVLLGASAFCGEGRRDGRCTLPVPCLVCFFRQSMG